MRDIKFFSPHLVSGPEDPAPIIILYSFLLKNFFTFSIFVLLIKNFVSVGQVFIFKLLQVNFFAASTKCKFFFLNKG